ncbi:MAG: hypothetical protein ACI935_001477 [Moritella dasanensis]
MTGEFTKAIADLLAFGDLLTTQETLATDTSDAFATSFNVIIQAGLLSCFTIEC